jgi:hypothetical protein
MRGFESKNVKREVGSHIGYKGSSNELLLPVAQCIGSGDLKKWRGQTGFSAMCFHAGRHIFFLFFFLWGGMFHQGCLGRKTFRRSR